MIKDTSIKQYIIEDSVIRFLFPKNILLLLFFCINYYLKTKSNEYERFVYYIEDKYKV